MEKNKKKTYKGLRLLRKAAFLCFFAVLTDVHLLSNIDRDLPMLVAPIGDIANRNDFLPQRQLPIAVALVFLRCIDTEALDNLEAGAAGAYRQNRRGSLEKSTYTVSYGMSVFPGKYKYGGMLLDFCVRNRCMPLRGCMSNSFMKCMFQISNWRTQDGDCSASVLSRKLRFCSVFSNIISVSNSCGSNMLELSPGLCSYGFEEAELYEVLPSLAS